MYLLRQRLLLVAGWVTAAVGAGVVASGAVAVAGGQVLDRPLRPLTAAEVAALPVVEVGAPDVFEPHASGGFVSTTGGPTQGSEDDAEDREGPAGAGGSTAIDESDADSGLLVEPPISDVELVSVEGGRVSFALEDGSLYLLWATPRPGNVASTRDATPEGITVAFSSSLGVWVVEATLVGDAIVITSGPEPLT
jgi:hypothetical protein